MNRQINHKIMRMIVGVIAVILAPAVHWFAGATSPLDSISISYWSDARDIFVGSLFVVGFFFAAYNGSGGKMDLEFYLSKVACVLVIIVALFPTEPPKSVPPPHWATTDLTYPEWIQNLIALVGLKSTHIEYIHFGAAILFFMCLITMMFFFSKRANRKGVPSRSLTYLVIAILMLIGIPLLWFIGNGLDWDYTTLIVEVWGMTLFGIGWFIAGAYKTKTISELSLNT